MAGRARQTEIPAPANPSEWVVSLNDLDRYFLDLTDADGKALDGIWCVDPRRVKTARATAAEIAALGNVTLSGLVRGRNARILSSTVTDPVNALAYKESAIIGGKDIFRLAGGTAYFRAGTFTKLAESFTFFFPMQYVTQKTTAVNAGIMRLTDAATGTIKWQIEVQDSGNLSAGYGTAGANAGIIPSASMPNNNTTFMVASVYDKASLLAKTYIDGITIKDVSNSTFTFSPGDTDVLSFGMRSASVPSINGRLGAVYYIPRALTEAEILGAVAAANLVYGVVV